jgi:hypothetical protein
VLQTFLIEKVYSKSSVVLLDDEIRKSVLRGFDHEWG